MNSSDMRIQAGPNTVVFGYSKTSAVEGREIEILADQRQWVDWADVALNAHTKLHAMVLTLCEGLDAISDHADEWTPQRVAEFAQTLRGAARDELSRRGMRSQ